MDRSIVVNTLLAKKAHKRYLEIGVQQGLTFNSVKANLRVAVDPKFLFDVNAIPASPDGDQSIFYEIVSDQYFASVIRRHDVFDVIFVDGLHTFEQTLRDLLNSSMYLSENGVIIIDDVLPNGYAASLRRHEEMALLIKATNDPNLAWMGDVFRLVFFIQYFMPTWSYATVAENHGQTILWRAPRAVPSPEMTVEEVSRTSYADSVLKREAFNVRPLAEIVAMIDADQASG